MPRSPRITFRLTPTLEALVSDRARQGSTVSDIVCEALEAYLGACPTSRQTQEAPSSDSILSSVSDILSDTVSDMLSDLVSAMSGMRERLAQLEARVNALSASVRQLSPPVAQESSQEILQALVISFAIFYPCGVFNPMKMPRQPQLR